VSAAEPPPPLHELQAQIMEVVWSRGQATVRDVSDELNAGSEQQRAYTTVMTVMHRLHAKGLLQRERRGRGDLYSAALTREQYMEARARVEVVALVDEFGDYALAHFADQVAGLDLRRRRRLRRLLKS
jgi:predicted transcriptional regulator